MDTSRLIFQNYSFRNKMTGNFYISPQIYGVTIYGFSKLQNTKFQIKNSSNEALLVRTHDC